jgi:hypothetical protein
VTSRALFNRALGVYAGGMTQASNHGVDLELPPMPRWLRALRMFWAGLLVTALAFSILMAVWGDLREALMSKVVAHRHNMSFLLQAPGGTDVWVGDEWLGTSRQHELAPGEPPDTDLKVEGMSVLVPRVYLRDGQLIKAAIVREPDEDNASLLARLAPDSEVLWTGEDTDGFIPALLLTGETLDFVCLCRFEFPRGEQGYVPSAFLLRIEYNDSHVFSVTQERVWSDRIWVPGRFWTQRDEYDGLPPKLDGQVKTVWEWHLHIVEDVQSWLDANIPPEHHQRAWRTLSKD